MTNAYDFVVIGGGIAGVSAAYELAAFGSVCLLEQEDHLAYHTTGRSAAISMESYGNATIRALTCASRAFYESPPGGLSETPLWSPRGALIAAEEAGTDKLASRYAAIRQLVPSVELVGPDEVIRLAPYLAPGTWASGIYEPSAFDLDVHAIHSAYFSGLRMRGGHVRRNAEVQEGHRQSGLWKLQLAGGTAVWAPCVVNAAGAWADNVATRCHVDCVGLRPLHRTVVVVDPGMNVDEAPYFGTIDEDIFIKPDVGRLMVSPCDETPSIPCDALPDEYDIAVTMDRLERMTQLRPRKVLNKWAGLRSFVSDRSPVVGADPQAEGFVWLAALGGYGIQAAPAIARLCRQAAIQGPMPDDLAALGVSRLELSPERCRNAEFSARAVEHVADLH